MKRIFEEKIGSALIVVVKAGEMFRGSVFVDGKATQAIEGADLEGMIATLRNDAGRLHPDYYGIEGAIGRFLSYFPEGFSDPRYIDMERQYKDRARASLLESTPLDKALKADAVTASNARKGFSTNLLSQFEAARLSEILQSNEGVDYLTAAAEFTHEPTQLALTKMERAIEPHGRASWPLLTYLPYLWAPERHMFLKPNATVDFASRTGSDFARAYSSKFDLRVYESLLELTISTEQKIGTLHPKDRIDVQSFIWVVGSYTDADLA